MSDSFDKTYWSKGEWRTAREICNERGIPDEVFLWRLERGLNGNCLFIKCLFFEIDGSMYTTKMLQEKYGVDRRLIHARHKAGKRGLDLIAKPLPSARSGSMRAGPIGDFGDEKKRNVWACDEHLRLLKEHHPDRAFEGRFSDRLDGGAAAKVYSSRLLGLASTQVRQSGDAWG